MTLKKSTLLVIFGITYIFSLRTVGTFIPAIFRNPQLVKIGGILSLFATFTLVFFFLSFYKDYVQPGQTKLQKASILGIIGASLVFLREIKNISPVFNIYVFRHQSWTGHIDAFAPWLNSIFLLIFFIAFYGEITKKKQMRLKKALLYAMIGTSIMALLRTILLSNYLFSGNLTFSLHFLTKIQIIVFPAFIFGFVTVLYFLITFYGEQKVLFFHECGNK